MQIEVYMTAQDFKRINALLLQMSGMAMYGAKDRHDRICEIDISTLMAPNMHYLLLIGAPSDGYKIVGQAALKNMRSDKVGFVTVRFGGEEVNALGATTYLADKSTTATTINRELTKILRRQAHRGVLDEASGVVNEKIYWTDDAWNSGRRKYLRFKDSQYGWRPKSDSKT